VVLVLRLYGERALEIGPVAGKAIRVTPRRLWRLGLEPSHSAGTDVAKSVDASHSCPGEVAGAKVMGGAIEGGLDLALEDEVGLLEGMVMGAGEPTEFRINNQSKGIVRVDLVAHGKTAHGAYPWRGKNAVSLVTKTVDNILKKYPVPQKEAWRTTANLSWIKTDNQTTNKVPDQAEARLDIRYLPQEIKTIKASLKDLVALPVKLKFVAFEPAQFTKSTNPFIKKLIQATHKITGKKPKIYSTHGGSDIRLFNARGIGGITFGPIGGGLHSDQEWVDIKSLNTYQKILTRFLISYT